MNSSSIKKFIKWMTLSVIVGVMSIFSVAGNAWAQTVDVTTADALNDALLNPDCGVITIDANGVGQDYSSTHYDTAIQLKDGVMTAANVKTIQGNGYVLYDFLTRDIGWIGKDAENVLTLDNVKIYASTVKSLTLKNLIIQNGKNDDSKSFHLLTAGSYLNKSSKDCPVLYVSSGGFTVTAENVQFLNNLNTNSNGGGALSTSNNNAYSTGAKLDFKNVTFKGNLANYYGGAMQIAGTDVLNLQGIFEDNHAGSHGGAVNIDLGSQVSNFGGIFVGNTSGYKVVDGRLDLNTIGDGNGGAIAVRGTPAGTSSDKVMNITMMDESVFKGNKVANYSNSSYLTGAGGAIYNGGGVFTINKATFGGTEDGEGNEARVGGALGNSSYANSYGIFRGQFTVSNSSFINNVAYEMGGAVFNGGPVYYYFSESPADGKAAGRYDISASITISNTEFKGNIVSSDNGLGGAVYSYGSMDISGSTFDQNKAAKGGAVYNAANPGKYPALFTGENKISNSSFTNNIATTAGGAIYNEAGCSLILENVAFSGNTANEIVNDIYNAGTITFKGTNTLNDGVVSVSGSSLLFDTEKESTTTIKGISTIDSLTVTDKAIVNLYDAVVTNGVTVESGGVLNLAGKLGVANVTGAGNVGLADDLTVNSDADLMNLNGNVKTIDMQQTSGTVVYNTVTVGTLTGNANLKIDAKLTGNTGDAGRNDKMDINAVSNSAKITLTSVNITEDTDSAIANLAVVTGNGAGALQVKDGFLRTITDDYVYTFTSDGEAGQIAVNKNVNVQSFEDYLQQDADASFSFTKNYVYSDSALEVTTSGTDKVKDVYLNGHSLTGKGMGKDGGITVADGYTLNMDGAPQSGSNSVISGFTTAFSVVSGGVLNLKDVTLSGNTTDISNAGTVNLSGTVTANSISGVGTLSNEGTLNIGASGLQNAVINVKGIVNLGKGTLGAAVTGGTLNVNEDVTANASYIAGVTNNVANGKALTLNGGAVANAITNSGTVKLTGVTGMSTVVTGGTLSIEQDLTVDASYIAGDDNVVAADKILNLNGNKAMAKTIANNGILNANVELQGVVKNTGTVNLNTGRYSDVGTSDYVPLSNFTGEGKFNLEKMAFYNTGSAIVFTTKIQGVDVYGASDKTSDDIKAFVKANKDLTIAVSDGIKLTLVGGFVEINDAYYTADYAKSAKNALETYKYDSVNLSKTGLVFTGKIVSAILDDPQKESHVLIQEIEEENLQPGQESLPPTEYDKAEVRTLNGSLFVGGDILKKECAAEKIAEVTKKGEGGKGIDVRDTIKSSISVGALDLANDATGIIVADDKGITVGGSEGKQTEVVLVKVNGDYTKPVNIVVGLTQDTADVLGVDKKGTFNIGNSQADKDAKYRLNGNLTVNEDSKVNIKGQTVITEGVTLNKAILTVEEGSKVTTPKVEIKGKAEVNGKGIVKTEVFVLDDSEANVSQVTKVETDSITVKSTDEGENSKKSSVMTGTIVANKLTMDKAKAKGSGNKTIVLHVGTNEKPAIVDVRDTNLGGNMLFLDPVWKDGVGLEGASHYATDSVNLDGAYVVGRNSILSFGATNAEADALFGSTGLKWGENEISAAAYVANQINVSGGSLMVDGSLTSAPDISLDDGSVKFADKSLFMVNGNNCQSNAAVIGVKSVEIANGAKLYINGAEAGTYKVLEIDSGAGTINIGGWQTSGNVLANSFVAFDSAEYKDSVVYITLKQADVDFSDTVVPNVAERMIKSPTGSLVWETMKVMLSDLYTEDQKTANINTYANLGENLGVTRGAYDVISMTGEAINQHWANKEDGESVWAVYNHSKNKVDGLKLGGMNAKYDAQYNGVTVGYDINKDFGVALNHVDGNVSNGFGGHNDAKYYGVSVYGRKNIGKVSLLGDVTYSHGKNELTQNGIEADAKTTTFSVGVTAKYATNIVKVGNVTPFAGVRYVRIDGKDYTDSLGINREADKVNSVIVPMGVEYSGEFKVSGSDWNCKPVLAVGYLFNFDDKDNTMTLGYNGTKDSFGYDFVDNGAFFTKAALNFTKKNLTLGVGYDYMKSGNNHNNRWNVNMNFTF